MSPSGALLGITASELQNSPFNSYLIPGIMLFTILGLLPIMIIFALLKKSNPNWPKVSIYIKICIGRGLLVSI